MNPLIIFDIYIFWDLRCARDRAPSQRFLKQVPRGRRVGHPKGCLGEGMLPSCLRTSKRDKNGGGGVRDGTGAERQRSAV